MGLLRLFKKPKKEKPKIDYVEGLITALEDENGDVRATAAGTLRFDKRAVELLIAVLGDKHADLWDVDYQVRCNAAHALGEIGDPRAVPSLEKAANDSNTTVAKNLAEELKNLVSTKETRYREAQEEIKSAESSIEKVEAFGCDVSNAFSRLKKANSAFDAGNYEEVIKHAKQSEETTKKIQEESRPETTLNLPEETFLPNNWKKIDVTIRNIGSMHARAIEIRPSDDVKFKRIPGIPISTQTRRK